MESLNCSEVEYEIINIENETGVVGATTIKLNLPPITDEEFPTVSIVVPTYDRKDFYELIMRNWEQIDYPREKLELIILDDSPGSSHIPAPTPLIFKNNPQIHYHKRSYKMTIGAKRNMLCSLAKNEYIVHMDDDDFYPPESVVCRIRILLDFQKKINKLACFGCTKVLCLDLISNQMFEAYDKSVDGMPATLSESTMAYSREYYNLQNWDTSSKFAECLPFIKNRHDTICTGPSVFIVTQFSHDSNTIQRRIDKTPVSEYNSVRFEGSLTVYDSKIFNDLRAKIIQKIPSYKEAINFLTNTQGLTLEKFKKQYKYLNEEIKTNPLIIDLYQQRMISKKTSTGKDLIYYCGPGSNLNFSSHWNPNSKQLGGSEEAVINLSNQFASFNYNVTVYCVLSGPSKKYGSVMYKNYYEWIPQDFQDITIIWRDPSNCKKQINSKNIFLDLHDAISPKWLEGLDKSIKIMAKSNYHAEILGINSIIIPNGIYPLVNYNQMAGSTERIYSIPNKIKNLLICTSSPDRCLRALLKAMPLIREEIPDAEIHWAYGFTSGIAEGGMEVDSRSKKWVEESKDLITHTPGFKDLGRLSQIEIKQLYLKADLFIYPTYFPEIDCISLTKAMSAGCIPVCTPSGAMAEKLGINKQMAKLINNELDYSSKDDIDFDNFVKSVILILKNPDRDNQRQSIIKYANEKYNWDTIGKLWIRNLKNY